MKVSFSTGKRFFLFFVVVAGAAGLLLQSCVSTRDREILSAARVYDQPYDSVWTAVEDLVYNELKCTPKKTDKKSGFLETEWIHRFDTEGTKRWMIEARIKKVQHGVQVLIDKRVEMQDAASKNINKYKKETNEPQSSGWKKQDIERADLEDLYRRVEQKLEYEKAGTR
jgi:hypothetical protein